MTQVQYPAQLASYAITPSGALAPFVAFTVYADTIGTLAAVSLTSGGAAVAGSVLQTDARGYLPTFWGPDGGVWVGQPGSAPVYLPVTVPSIASVGGSAAITAETARAEAAEATLTSGVAANAAAISSEATSRAAADSAEVAARNAAIAAAVAGVAPGGVTSFQTRTGAVTLSKTDVTGTGLAAADVGAAAAAALTSEVSRATAAEGTNAAAITAEATTRAAADTTNATAISAEATARAAAISSAVAPLATTTALTAETTRATTAESVNATAISAEATARASGDAASLQKSNNLSDIASAATARSNLGLGTAATAATGTASGQVPLLGTGGVLAPAQLGTGTPTALKWLRGDGTWTTVSVTGEFLGSASTFAGLPTTDAAGNAAQNGDYASLTADVVGTGTATAPQYPRGLYAYSGTAFSLLLSISADGALIAANNLSDLGSAATARTNLGLGTAATSAASAFDASGAAATAQAASLQKTNNLSDLASASTARTNLGLGTAATAASSAFDASGAASTAQTAAQTFATSAIATQHTADVAAFAPAGAVPTQAVAAATSNVASLTGLPTLDGVTLTDGQVGFLGKQTAASQNGAYVFHASGAATRVSSLPTGADATGLPVLITGGNTLAGQTFTCTSAMPNIIGTNTTTWTSSGISQPAAAAAFSPILTPAATATTATPTGIIGQTLPLDPTVTTSAKAPAIPTAGTAQFAVQMLSTAAAGSTVPLYQNDGTTALPALVLPGEIKYYQATAGDTAWHLVDGFTPPSQIAPYLLANTLVASPPTDTTNGYLNTNTFTTAMSHVMGYYKEPSGGWSGTTRPANPPFFFLDCTTFADTPSWTVSGDVIVSQSGS